MKKEYLDVLDQFGNKIGVIKTREQIHQDGDFHRVVHTWIYNEKGEILLQKRSKQKENHPECWDISSAGHVHALEKPLEGVVREAKEELGIQIDPNKLEYLTTIKRTNNNNREFADIYALEIDSHLSFHFHDQEVENAKFFCIPQIQKFLQNEKSNVVKREEYPIIFQKIAKEKNLQL